MHLLLCQTTLAPANFQEFVVNTRCDIRFVTCASLRADTRRTHVSTDFITILPAIMTFFIKMSNEAGDSEPVSTAELDT